MRERELLDKATCDEVKRLLRIEDLSLREFALTHDLKPDRVMKVLRQERPPRADEVELFRSFIRSRHPQQAAAR